MLTIAKLAALKSSPELFRQRLTVQTAAGRRELGSILADFQRERFAALDTALLAMVDGRAPDTRRFWWEATKGASKDSDLAVAILWLLAFCPRPLTCQVGAADADQADELRKAAKSVLRLNPWLEEVIEIQSFSIINKRTDSCCEIIPADIAGSHGARPDLLVINELSHVTKREFADNLMDNAAKVSGGVVVIATNAGFVPSWQYDLRELARTSPRWSFHQFDRPAPWIDQAELAERRLATTPSRYDRLWGGIWSRGGGDALAADVLDAAIHADLGPMRGDEPGWQFVAGLDLGITRDHAALVIIGKHLGSYEQVPIEAKPRNRMAELLADFDIVESPPVAFEERFTPATSRIRLAHVESWRPPVSGQVDLADVEAAIGRAHHQFNLAGVFYDPFQAAFMAQRLTQANVPMAEVTFAGRNLDAMASELLEQFNSRNVDLWDQAELIADLRQLNIVEKSYGYKIEAKRTKDGGHGDRATAFALALHGAKSCFAGARRAVRGPLTCYP